MCSDELLGCDTVQRRVSISLARIHIRSEANFEMQVRQIGTFSRAHRADLVAAMHILPDLHSDGVEMGIHGLDHRAEFVSVRQTMRDEDHLAPAGPGDARINHASGSSSVNGSAHIGVAAADAV